MASAQERGQQHAPEGDVEDKPDNLLPSDNDRLEQAVAEYKEVPAQGEKLKDDEPDYVPSDIHSKWEEGEVNRDIQKNAEDATETLEKGFKDVTGNEWEKGECIGIHLGLLTFGNTGEGEEDDGLILPYRTGIMIKLIFSDDMFTDQMKSMHIDLKKMPLHNLKRANVDSALELLKNLEDAVSSHKAQEVLSDLSGRIYELVPQEFDNEEPAVIDTYAKVQDERQIVMTLSDIELTLELEEHQPVPSLHPIMDMYRMLDCGLELLDKDSPEFKLCHQYSSASSKIKKEHLLDVWRVDRKGERERFAAHDDIKNRKLLWHGTSLAVVVAILKAGLRIMPHSGGLVGEGIYFASEHAKSYRYVVPYHSKFEGEDKVGFMFLVEVALGQEKSICEHHNHLVEAPPGFDCVVARGSREPNPKENQIINLDGHEVVVPLGNPVPVHEWSHSIFEHSEYIIYKESQARIRYMLKFSLA